MQHYVVGEVCFIVDHSHFLAGYPGFPHRALCVLGTLQTPTVTHRLSRDGVSKPRTREQMCGVFSSCSPSLIASDVAARDAFRAPSLEGAVNVKQYFDDYIIDLVPYRGVFPETLFEEISLMTELSLIAFLSSVLPDSLSGLVFRRCFYLFPSFACDFPVAVLCFRCFRHFRCCYRCLTLLELLISSSSLSFLCRVALSFCFSRAPLLPSAPDCDDSLLYETLPSLRSCLYDLDVPALVFLVPIGPGGSPVRSQRSHQLRGSARRVREIDRDFCCVFVVHCRRRCIP